MAPRELCLIVTISLADNVERDGFQYVPVGEAPPRVSSLLSGYGTKSEIHIIAMKFLSVGFFYYKNARDGQLPSP